MILDPILRFNWIFYSIYTHDLQHSTIASFFVGFTEVTRRGIWTIFRVENEHCANVARFKASRDVPLPYDIESSPEDSTVEPQQSNSAQPVTPGTPASKLSSFTRQKSRTTGRADLGDDAQQTPDSEFRRRGPPTRTFTTILANAHTQDFEKKRKPGADDTLGATKKDIDDDEVVAGVSSSDEDSDVEDAEGWEPHDTYDDD